MIARMLFALLLPLAAENLQQAHDVDVKVVLSVLQKGSLDDREAMVRRVVEVEAMKKSPALAAAIGEELRRMNDVVAQRQRRIAAGVADPTAPAIGEYIGLLVQACAQSNDPTVIDGLLGAIHTGNMATRALARFGSASYERVVVLAERGVEPMTVVGALRTLDQMDRIGALSPTQRAQSLGVVRQRLSGRQPYLVIREAIEIAASAGQAELRSRVQAIAAGEDAPIIADHKELGAELSRVARSALAKQED